MNPFPDHTPASNLLQSLSDTGVPSLGPGNPKKGSWLQELNDLSNSQLLGVDKVRDHNAAQCIRSGLLLYGELLDSSHDISQDIHTTEGSYWHGIMHRKEPDYPNAKYWFRRVGDHPLFEALPQEGDPQSEIRDQIQATGIWDPFEFVDEVERAVRGRNSDAIEVLERLQDFEMRALFAHCYRLATG